MKGIKECKVLHLIFLFLFCKICAYEKHIVVVVPSRNNSQWYKKNLDSVLNQKYSNYQVIYIDDQSTDNNGILVENYLKNHKNKDKVTLIQNKIHVGALENYYNAIHSLQKEVIVVTSDGDDWLAHQNVLSRINEAYQDPNVWLTYGSYSDTRSGRCCCRSVTDNIKKKRLFRKNPWVFSHLRTFYAGLFQKIAKEDLMYEGKFFEMAWDLAFMFPMLEMAGDRFRFIKEVLYIYNIETSMNDFKIDLKKQELLEHVIRFKRSYAKVDTYL